MYGFSLEIVTSQRPVFQIKLRAEEFVLIDLHSLQGCSLYQAVPYVYWTVHHLDS